MEDKRVRTTILCRDRRYSSATPSPPAGIRRVRRVYDDQRGMMYFAVCHMNQLDKANPKSNWIEYYTDERAQESSQPISQPSLTCVLQGGGPRRMGHDAMKKYWRIRMMRVVQYILPSGLGSGASRFRTWCHFRACLEPGRVITQRRDRKRYVWGLCVLSLLLPGPIDCM